MTRAQKIWDFLFGVTLIGGAPIAMFCVAGFVLRLADISRFVGPVILICASAAFACACLWRKKHRVLPGSFFVAEVATAICATVLFMVFFVAAGYAAYRAD